MKCQIVLAIALLGTLVYVPPVRAGSPTGPELEAPVCAVVDAIRAGET